jgi:hypothetical protein
MSGTEDKVKEFGTKIITSLALSAIDVEILKKKVEADEKRETIFDQLEKGYQSDALTAYNKSQVDKRLVKAMLIPRTGEVTSSIEFMFNPKEFNLMHKIQLENMNGSRTVRGLPKVNYGFVEPRTINLQGLIFDTYEQRTSVLTKLQPLLDAFDFSKFYDPFTSQKTGDKEYKERILNVSMGTEVKNIISNVSGVDVVGMDEYGAENLAKQPLKLRRPPVYYFIWGEKNYMCCMIENANFKLMMFLPDGTPVRASVDISLREVDLGVASRAYSPREKSLKSGQ